ncbi:MAG TPA: twin-arginine translocase TatA/TatE family subunit [Candidatus Polarisedimenticolaceae bacterium]|nr:twin-arginine translocase TatA/TatE family subunit [Candidatus Polarisedimenticolaceae bacterium]
MFGIGLNELIIILVLVLLFFGGKKLPELSRSLGEGVKELRRGFSEDPAKPVDKAAKTK